MSFERETANQSRGMISRAVVTAQHDGGEAQTVDVTTHASVDRSAVEVVQQFGFTSMAPGGAMVVVLAVGGDQSDLVALPVAAPGARLGGLNPGDTAIYSANGSRIIIRADGVIEVNATQKVVGKAPNWDIEGDVKIKGDVDIDGELRTSRDIRDKTGAMSAMRDQYNGHGHQGASPPPNPLMQ